ncbi:MAG TPA: MFS transporter, partial [Jatrophihabitans sp.]|nr:MFS transporter [Jatrophihabitans sp.]
LLAVSVLVGAADITFTAASGACLKGLVRPADLLVANSRLESTNWTAVMLGPPLGGAAIGLLGPVTTVLANAVSFLLSACGIRAMGGTEPAPRQQRGEPAGGLLAGWRYLLGHRALRPLFYNTVLVNGLIMATAPLLAVLMLGRLGFAPWQYGLAFALPSLGGLLGSRLAVRLVARFGRHRVLLATGTARACWSEPLAFVRPGVAGLALVMAVEFGLICCASVFNPVYSSYRLEQIDTHRLARTLSAWSVTGKAGVAALTALWGVLAGLIGLRPAIGLAGLLLLASPLLLPRQDRPAGAEPELVAAQAG